MQGLKYRSVPDDTASIYRSKHKLVHKPYTNWSVANDRRKWIKLDDRWKLLANKASLAAKAADKGRVEADEVALSFVWYGMVRTGPSLD